MRPSFTLGIEEESQTADPETRDLRSHITAPEFRLEGKMVAMLVLLATVALAYAQEIVVMQAPVSARDLSGIVSDTTGAPLAGVRVTLFQCAVDYPRLQPQTETIASAKTNETGAFSLPKGRKITPSCLRFQLNGFNQYVIRVHFVPSAPDLKIKLTPAA